MDTTPFAKAISDIADSIERVSPKALVLRDTWHAYHRQLTLLSEHAPNSQLIGLVVEAAFFCWEIQDTRGPKSKDKVRERMLYHLRDVIPMFIQLANERSA